MAGLWFFCEVRMFEDLLGCWSLIRIKLKHLLNKFVSLRWHHWKNFWYFHWLGRSELHKIRKLRGFFPGLFCRSTSDSKNFLKLVYLTDTREKMVSEEKLSKNTSSWPDICGRAVECAWEELLWGPVINSGCLFRMLSFWWTIDFSRVEIDNFDHTIISYDHVCRFKIPMHNPIWV